MKNKKSSVIKKQAALSVKLCEILMPYAGERGYNESAVDVLNRLVIERNNALNGIGEFAIRAEKALRVALVSTLVAICCGIILIIFCRRLKSNACA
jgi:hypothetical protein